MDPVRIGPSLPALVESDASVAAETKLQAQVDSVAPSTTQSETAAGSRGQVFQPSTGDEVLVSFEHGDARAPYLIGGLWNAEAPPTSAAPATKASDGNQSGGAPEPGTHKDKWLSEEQAKIIGDHLRTSK
jgi:hypothetical protein